MPGGWIEVLVDGELPADVTGEFLGVHADRRQGATLLRGVVRDQAELVGMVARVETFPCRSPEERPYGPWTVRARGRVREDLADWLEGFAVSHEGGCTVLVGPVDQGATSVVRLLLHLQAAGLEIVDVRRERLADPDDPARRDHRP